MAKVEADFDRAAKQSAQDRQQAGLSPTPTIPAGSSSSDRVTQAMSAVSDYYKPGSESSSPPAPAPTGPTEHDPDQIGKTGVTWP
jgi:hypothetical protein